MANTVESDDPNMFVVNDVAVNHVEKGHLGSTDIAFTTFICDKCDRTHVVFQSTDMDTQFNMSLETKDAEKLADMLLNPKLVDPKKFK